MNDGVVLTSNVGAGVVGVVGAGDVKPEVNFYTKLALLDNKY